MSLRGSRPSPRGMYEVFEVKVADAPRVDAALKDPLNPKSDLVSRQSVLIRDARALNLPGEGRLVLVEGTEAALAAARELFKDFATRLEGPAAEAAYRAFKAQDEDVASGIGFIFG